MSRSSVRTRIVARGLRIAFLSAVFALTAAGDAEASCGDYLQLHDSVGMPTPSDGPIEHRERTSCPGGICRQTPLPARDAPFEIDLRIDGGSKTFWHRLDRLFADGRAEKYAPPCDDALGSCEFSQRLDRPPRRELRRS